LQRTSKGGVSVVKEELGDGKIPPGGGRGGSLDLMLGTANNPVLLDKFVSQYDHEWFSAASVRRPKGTKLSLLSAFTSQSLSVCWFHNHICSLQ
jgi:hypothetical protein